MAEKNRRMQQGGFRIALGTLLAAGILCVGYTGLQWFLEHTSITAGPQKLFPPEHPRLSVLVLAALLLWIGSGPAWVADFLTSRPRQLPFLPLWSVPIGLLGWTLLRFAVTEESVGMIMGQPVWGWGGEWEWLCRFLALQTILTLSLFIAGISVNSILNDGLRTGLSRGGLTAAYSAPWLVLAWTVVVGGATSSNLTQFVRSTPVIWIGPACLTGFALILAFIGSLLSYAWRRQRIFPPLLVTLGTPLLVIPASVLFWCGLEPAVVSGLATGSRAEFLFAAVWFSCAAVFVLAVGGAIGHCFYWPRSLRSPPVRDATGKASLAAGQSRWAARVYLLVMTVHSLFLIYGSLIPFNFEPMSVGSAVATFQREMGLHASPWSQSDMVTNVFMFVPFSFCALGAWTCHTRRPVSWSAMAVILLASGLLGCLLEFSQVFVPNRISSIHDIIAQAMGSVLGMGAWSVCGLSLTRWFAAIVREHDRPTLAMRLLYTYAALLCLYSLLPLNFTLSLGHIWDKYQAGMINFVPFGNPRELQVIPMVMKTVLYIPIGYLLACHGAGRGRPLLASSLGGIVFAAAIESMQVVVRSRFATATDVVLGALGAGVGGFVAMAAGAVTHKKVLHAPWWQRGTSFFKLAAMAGCLSLIIYQRWESLAPLFFQAQGTVKSTAGSPVTLGNMVYYAGPLNAASRLAQEFGAWLIFGMLVQAVCNRSDRWRLLGAAVSVAVVLILEYCRWQFGSHRFDLLLTAAAVGGAAASFSVYPRFVKVFLTPDDENSPSETAGPET